MNHTTTTKKNLVIVGVLAAITAAALTGTIAISNVQTAAAYNTNSTDPNSSNNNNSTDIENSATNFKFKQKEKNNCSGGSANCCNIASQTTVDLKRAIIVPLSITPVPLCPIED